MKKHLYALAILGLVLNSCGPVYVVQRTPPPPPQSDPMPPPPPESEPEATYQSFYDDLSPYGQWIDDPNYGYVWLPDAGPDFKPYATNGQWVYTEDGWSWASNYPWGWAAFHYGRWFFADGYGWMWVPGNEWAPAWVTWRNSDEYYGWAPMEPGVGFNLVFGGGYNPPPHYWSFVPHQYVSSPQIRNYYVNETRNVTIINRTTVINHTTVINNNVPTRNVNYGRGPDPNEVGRYSGNAVRPLPIRPSSRPGEQVNNGGLVIYRPRINDVPRNNAGNNGGSSRPAPPRAIHLNNVRPVNTTVYGGNDGRPRGDNNRPDNRNDGRPQPDNNRPDNKNDNTGFPNRNNPVINRPPTQQPVVQPGNPPQGRPAFPTQPQDQPVRQQPQPAQPQPAQPQPSQPSDRPLNNRPSVQQPSNQPVSRPIGRPFTPAQPQDQPVRQQPQPVQPQPAQPQPSQPSDRPVTRPGVQPPANHPVTQPVLQRPFSRPAPQPPTNQPVARPAVQQPVNHPVFNRPTPSPQAPAVQPRPVARPVTPPPAPKKDPDKKDTRS